MNIFVTDSCPTQCAINLDDKRLNKMIVESCQLLSTTVHKLAPSLAHGLYKQTHANHPCAKWLRKSYGNYIWLIEHTNALLAEYEWRFNKTHLSKLTFIILDKLDISSYYDLFRLTPFANVSLTKTSNVCYNKIFIDYRYTMINKWNTTPAKWTNRHRPDWYNGN